MDERDRSSPLDDYKKCASVRKPLVFHYETFTLTIRTMKKVLFILFGIFAAIALFIVGVFALTSGMAKVANEFFDLTKDGKDDQAWALLSKEFQKTTNRDELKSFLQNKGLTNVTETTWNSRAFENHLGEIKGTVKTESGREIALEVDFFKEEDGWRIQYIGLDGKDRVGTTPEVPSEDDQIALIEESLTVFGKSINTADFTPFIDHISKTWRDGGVTAEQLNEAFAAFINNKVDILPMLDSLTPAFDTEPTVADNGVLTIAGHYPSTPSKLFFKFDYIKEGNSWKVVSTAVNLK